MTACKTADGQAASPTEATAVVPSTTVGTASSPTSTGATSTTFDNPFSDEEIAQRLLLDADEYGAGWQVFGYKRVTLDRALALEVPGCAAYLDTVFEGAGRPAVTAWRFFHAPPGRPAAMSQYVVVFPDAEAAEAMFQATKEPAFMSDCLLPYREITADPTGYCCNPEVPFTPALAGAPQASDATLGTDEIAFRTEQQTWTDADGTRHGPETIVSATLRVGRTITVIETIEVDEFGEPFVEPEQFHHAIATVSQRSVHALGGVNH